MHAQLMLRILANELKSSTFKRVIVASVNALRQSSSTSAQRAAFASATTSQKQQPQSTAPEDIVASALKNLKSSDPSAVEEAATSAAPVAEPTKESKCLATKLRISPIKLRWVANQVRGLSYYEAWAQLSVSVKRKASDFVRVALDSARFNAENQLGLDPTLLYISHITVGTGPKLKRMRRHARARTGVMHHRYARLEIRLQEGDPEKFRRTRSGKQVQWYD